MVIDGRNLAINNPLNTEEVFGPIAVFNSFSSVDDAIEKQTTPHLALGQVYGQAHHPDLSSAVIKLIVGQSH